jgi:hypothetical protein
MRTRSGTGPHGPMDAAVGGPYQTLVTLTAFGPFGEDSSS